MKALSSQRTPKALADHANAFTKGQTTDHLFGGAVDKRVEKIDSATLVISEYGRPSRILVQKSKLLVVSGPLLDVLMTQEN